MSPQDLPSKYTDPSEASRIYFLPNLMTAGNLFCGFLSIIRCIQANYMEKAQKLGPIISSNQDPLAYLYVFGGRTPTVLYEQAVWLILAAVIFDGLDGRLARLGGKESLFGKEFDSIADIVSFGIAPSLMVFFIILKPNEYTLFFQSVGWLVGFIYLLCAAIRLARFNVITHPVIIKDDRFKNSDFIGLPVPAAAGLIASLVLYLNSVEELKRSAIVFPILLLLVAYLMVSNVRYPSFKSVDWQTQIKSRTLIFILVGIALAFYFYWFAIPLLFLGYIFYGLSKHYQRMKSKHLDNTIEDFDGNPPPSNCQKKAEKDHEELTNNP